MIAGGGGVTSRLIPDAPTIGGAQYLPTFAIGELTAVLAVGDVLIHARTGERLTVLARSADELVLKDLWPAAHHVPEHRHPRMSEHWQLLSGRASFSIAGIEHVLAAGQKVMAGAVVVHSACVLGAEPARVAPRRGFIPRHIRIAPEEDARIVAAEETLDGIQPVAGARNAAPLSREGSTPSARTGALLMR